MNDGATLVILFAALVTIYAAGMLAVLMFFGGAKRGRSEYESWLAGEIERAAHRCVCADRGSLRDPG